jgi:hypothetical protein
MTTTSETPKPVTAYCRTCGKPLTEDTVRVAMGTVFCEEHVPPPAGPASGTGAGSSPYAATSPYASQAIPNPSVSPGLGFLLGLIPGVGAIYNGQYAKGIVHVLILGFLFAIVSNEGANGLEPVFGLLIPVFWFYMAFEAYHTAQRRMRGEPVDEFSSLIKLGPKAGQYPVLPVTLIVLGVLFLLNNLDLLRIAAVFKFWPVLLISAGVFLLYARFQGGAKEETGEFGSGMSGLGMDTELPVVKAEPPVVKVEPPQEAGRE